MTESPNSRQNSANQPNLPTESPDSASGNGSFADRPRPSEYSASAGTNESDRLLSSLARKEIAIQQNAAAAVAPNRSASWVIVCATALMFVGIILNNFWIGISGSIVALLLSLRLIWPLLQSWLNDLQPHERSQLLGIVGFLAALLGLLKFIGVYDAIGNWLQQIKWDEFGSWAEWTGAVGQIMIAVLAVYIAWRQYVISKDLTIQQNIITQQQTIDAYFQGVSDLALDDEGMLEDWPQERVFAEGRTAAILTSIDAQGKAKVLRFLSQSRLLSPLKRDQHLGRPILNGFGGYEEDREYGVRVIDLGVMLAGANISRTDLRWVELSEANLVRADLSSCDLAHANLSRAILYEANLAGADLKGTRLFYGSAKTASPRSRTILPDYETGAHTGAVVENTDFTDVQRLSEEQRYYCCAWGGEKTRSTIPGGCVGIPNKLGH
ncbi:pentapeptide repeat-containing protein [Aerosakkonema funiforme]|uniref:Pentapeptide repeat-containing protein n=1 Tax=Aerosakkonema funiforme FACHB-1375 TaxID=2949571 RepID=A0A926ZKT2_9CYAN|nr:pentapeptide repeat-containing protein [Aerosakkonema funiforme]MBD2186054.1 pentapeptide repeat-containing protein [Aerosakkonema funiforme FACHB-1375]